MRHSRTEAQIDVLLMYREALGTFSALTAMSRVMLTGERSLLEITETL